MSHPFGDLLTQYRARKQGLSQARLADAIGYDPTIVGKMCKCGKELTGPSGRDRVVQIIQALRTFGVLSSLAEANALLAAADMPPLYDGLPVEATLVQVLQAQSSAASPPLQTSAGSMAARRMNLPAQLTSFIGRENEIAELTERATASRLLTLTGSGGVGKTRLALEVAGRLVDTFADGVWLAELAQLSDPALVPQMVVSALKLPEQPGRTYLDTLTAYLKAKHLLLILDNCEHLIDACAALAEALLHQCPCLHVLATSRETLRIGGEATYCVPSLTAPEDVHIPIDDLLDYEAVRLFRERAVTAQSAFEWSPSNAVAVSRICSQLDGIPLAIELAVSRLNALSAGQIAERLTDRFNLLTSGSRTALPRHQTLRAAIAWSYALLTQPEQEMLAALSVFAGGFTAEAAEFVSGQPDTLTLLSHLVNKSLVIAAVKGGAMRYRLLETIRQFAQAQLERDADVERVRRLHAEYFLRLAEAAEPHFHDSKQRQWLERLEQESDNYRATLAWGQSQIGDPELGLRTAIALWQFWWLRCHLSEGRRWTEALLRLAHAGMPPRLRAWATLAAAPLGTEYYGYVMYLPMVPRMLEEALAAFRELGDDAGSALALCRLGVIAGATHDPARDAARALALTEESLSVSLRQNTDPWITSHILYRLGSLSFHQADLPCATTYYERCLDIARQRGDTQLIIAALIQLADILGAQLDFARAAKLAEEALAKAREAGDLMSELNALCQLADEYRFLGEFDRAAALIEEMHHAGSSDDVPHTIDWAATMLGLIARDRGDYETAAAYFKESIVQTHDVLQARINWPDLMGLATIASARGELKRAARLFGGLNAWLVNSNILRFPHNQRQYGSYIDATQVQLGDAAYAVEFERGRMMTTEEAYEYALSDDSTQRMGNE